VVDDDDYVRKAIVFTLANRGYAVDAAASGEDGWLMLQKNRYDAATIDHVMGEMTGMDLIRRIRTSTFTEKLPVVVLTNSLEPSDVEPIQKLGVEEIVIKTQTSIAMIGDVVDKIFRKRD
jgi:CheY-like chemotaxis protein